MQSPPFYPDRAADPPVPAKVCGALGPARSRTEARIGTSTVGQMPMFRSAKPGSRLRQETTSMEVKRCHDLANGAGALSSLIGVPEPSSIVLAFLVVLLGSTAHRAKRVYQIC